MDGYQLVEKRDVLWLDNPLEADKLGVVAALEVVGGIVNERDTVRHARAEVAPDFAQDDGDASCHVLAGVVARSLDHGRGSAVAHAEAFSRAAGGEQAPRRCAVKHGVPYDDVFVPGKLAVLERPDHHLTAAHPFADIIVGVALEDQAHAFCQERAETLAGAPRKPELRWPR